MLCMGPLKMFRTGLCSSFYIIYNNMYINLFSLCIRDAQSEVCRRQKCAECNLQEAAMQFWPLAGRRIEERALHCLVGINYCTVHHGLNCNASAAKFGFVLWENSGNFPLTHTYLSGKLQYFFKSVHSHLLISGWAKSIYNYS